ncbi:MAG: S1 RNA-binding domain-containing protein, partial [Pseudomonadota bacterium]
EIKNITEFGLFVGLPGDIDGMVHLSDIDWNRSGEDAVRDYAKGQIVKVQVLDVDMEKERISLGIKQLSDDPFAGTIDAIRKGEVVTCTVAGQVENGIEVNLGDGALGFIRKSELSRERSEQRPDRFAVGEKVDAKITNIDKKTRRITLSIKAREMDEEKKAVAEYGSTESGASLGDILGAALNKAQAERGAAKKDETKDEAKDEEKAGE